MWENPLPHIYTRWNRVWVLEGSYTTITVVYNVVTVIHICKEKNTPLNLVLDGWELHLLIFQVRKQKLRGLETWLEAPGLGEGSPGTGTKASSLCMLRFCFFLFSTQPVG